MKIALLLAAAALAPAHAQDGATAAAESRWYLERGTHRREALPADDVPDVAFELEALMRDGGIPGFYDGQFASTADSPEELERIARDDSMHHVLRMMAVMALQEATDGDELRAALEPLVIAPHVEFGVELQELQERYNPSMDPDWTRRKLDAELSRYSHFALAKAGVTEHTLAKIAAMESYVDRRMHRILDPTLDSARWGDVDIGRTVVFDIAYHYQQFDDYEHAATWFEKLTDNLAGKSDTRWAHYNLACMAALSGRPQEAIGHLREAYEVGFLDIEWMDEDGDLASIRELPEYRALRDEMLGR